MSNEPFIIVGLGNPGPKYENTRHNLGFLTLDHLAEENGISVSRIKFKSLTGAGNIAGHKVVLVKPQTYMNLSGEAVREAVSFYKIPPEHLIVIYDDLDIPTGSIRIRRFGSAGTHNGMRSIVQHLGYENFPRIRVGIGAPGPNDDLISHVLGRPYIRQEQDSLKSAMERAAQGALAFLSEGADSAMRTCNTQ